MPKNFKPPAKISVKGMSITDPRVTMRALIGLLLAANLAVAVVAFKPFGGSADDLRQEQARLSAQLRKAQQTLADTKDHVAKIAIARKEGDDFLVKYIMQARTAPALTVEEMNKDGNDSGVRILPENYAPEDIEGSETLKMVSITAGFEGNYAGLTKLVNLLEKSPRFFIIESMNLNAPQQNGPRQADATQNLNVTLKVLTFVRDDAGASE